MKFIKQISLRAAVGATVVASMLAALLAAGGAQFALAQTYATTGATTVTTVTAPITTAVTSTTTTGVNANVNANATAGNNAPSASNGTLDITVAGDGSFNASQATVAADTMTATDASMVSSVNVSSDNDLALYAQAVLKADPKVEAVAASNAQVSVSYYEPAEVFGFIPANIRTTAVVDSSGNASIHYPWYRFLTAVNDSDLQASVAAQASTNATASAQAEAYTISQLYAALKAHADASASASASTTASTSTSGSY